MPASAPLCAPPLFSAAHPPPRMLSPPACAPAAAAIRPACSTTLSVPDIRHAHPIFPRRISPRPPLSLAVRASSSPSPFATITARHPGSDFL
ncbi:hypothetical protein CVT26_007591 [Gymnopilus dilepis]|uniref:Uncharacterized protein n=1 Tax=Gymnopilus dilepis TaxID=231916 RepID=A0A409VZR8_9AGAR|nr:hypothetical protein CVT26_007591 [Gymnopilus dilepis]